MHHVVRHVKTVKSWEHRVNHDRRLFKNRRRRTVKFTHAACKTHLFQKLVTQVAGKVNTKRKERRKDGAAKAAEQKRNGNDHRHFAEYQVNGRQEAERRAGIRHPQNAIVNAREQTQVDSDHRQKSKVLAHDERHAANGLRKQREYRPPLDFFLHKADAHENGNQEARKAHHRKRRRLDDVGTVKHRPLAKHNTKERKRNRQKTNVIQNLVANGFAERVEGNNANVIKRLHGRFPPSKYLRDSDACGPSFLQRFRSRGSNRAGGHALHRQSR